MNTHRLSIRVPYTAMVVPHGARVVRPMVFRTDVPVDLRVVPAGDLPVAVSCRDMVPLYQNDSDRLDYVGNDGRLWLPIFDDEEWDGILRVETALDQLARGHGTLGWNANPFAAVGAKPVRPQKFAAAVPIEDVVLRAHEGDDRNEVAAAVGRLANDLILCEDGRVLRASPGPFWVERNGSCIDLMATGARLPDEHSHPFGVGRLETAAEFLKVEFPKRPWEVRGRAVIEDPGCLPDLDGLLTARSIVRQTWGRSMQGVLDLVPPEARACGEKAIAAAAVLHAMTPGTFVGEARGPAREGAPPATPEQIVAAVDEVRSFLEDHVFPDPSPRLKPAVDVWRRLYEQQSEPAIRRWDVYERDRLPVAERAPDLGAPAPGAAR
ncbi:hypothetical protein PQI07_25615 [Methylobacterium sp. 092160098-2]|uniref:hypothetical protein n=1 Tax=Methylobacterium sp. 092160098-2 TaxID=3025129 RepID=UPI0023819E6A|nr:hypothetical protein [Methylobacterium sp. 092160098-2]MDE4914053.1 hypothetical protein [Methylobacterium sp. 092160098-2]